MAKANLVDDPYNKIQLQTDLGKDFFKTISSSARITIKHIEFFRVLRNIVGEFELVIFVGKGFQRRRPVNFREERRPYWVY